MKKNVLPPAAWVDARDLAATHGKHGNQRRRSSIFCDRLDKRERRYAKMAAC
jgi:hypothetical protein